MVRDVDHPDHRLGGEDLIAARGQLRVVLAPRAELSFAADTTRNDANPLYYSKILAVKPGFVVDNPAELHDVRASFPAEGHVFQSGASVRFAMDLTPAIRLTSLTAYRQVDFDVLIDGDISELDLTASHVHELQHQVSEEVTVAYRGPRVTWVTGLFFFGEVDRQPSSIFARGPRLENRLDPRVEASATRRVRASDGAAHASRGRDSGPSLHARAKDHRQPHRAVHHRRPGHPAVQFVGRVYRCDLE